MNAAVDKTLDETVTKVLSEKDNLLTEGDNEECQGCRS